MSAYRFCRSDDVPLLVEAYNRCRLPHAPELAPLTVAEFKRQIREIDLWCSSSMVAFEGADPIGVLLGAKRATETLVHTIAVHPDHLRRGHGRHLLTSLSAKLAILGPPRLVAEVPVDLAPACALFDACSWEREAILTDWVLDPCDPPQPPPGLLTIPVTVDDLDQNGLLADDANRPWERSADTIRRRKADLCGLAFASEERIEAYVLHRPGNSGTREIAVFVVANASGAGSSGSLLAALASSSSRAPLVFPKVHPEEIVASRLERWGFRPVAAHVRFAATARAA